MPKNVCGKHSEKKQETKLTAKNPSIAKSDFKNLNLSLTSDRFKTTQIAAQTTKKTSHPTKNHNFAVFRLK